MKGFLFGKYLEVALTGIIWGMPKLGRWKAIKIK
jgi:hypothetical protein